MGGTGGGGNPPSDYPIVEIKVRGRKLENFSMLARAEIEDRYRRGTGLRYGPDGVVDGQFEDAPHTWTFDQNIVEATRAKLKSCPSLDDALEKFTTHTSGDERDEVDIRRFRSGCWKMIHRLEELFAVDQFIWTDMAFLWREIELQAMLLDPEVNLMIERFNGIVGKWTERKGIC